DCEIQVRVAVDGVDLDVVEQLDAGNRDAVGEHLDHAVDRAVERLERARGGGHRLGGGRYLQRRLGDQPERALGADHQVREVVPGTGFPRTRARGHYFAAGGDDFEAEDVLAHRAVADARGARGAGGDHAADGRVRAGVD